MRLGLHLEVADMARA